MKSVSIVSRLAITAPTVTNPVEIVSERVGFSPLTKYSTVIVAKIALLLKAKNLHNKTKSQKGKSQKTQRFLLTMEQLKTWLQRVQKWLWSSWLNRLAPQSAFCQQSCSIQGSLCQRLSSQREMKHLLLWWSWGWDMRLHWRGTGSLAGSLGTSRRKSRRLAC